MRFIWTKKLVLQQAVKYNVFKEFKDNSNAAYKAAWRKGWLNEITSHMTRYRVPHTYEECKLIALNYSTKKDFISDHSSLYIWAQKNGFIGDLCKHMIPVGSLYKRCIYAVEFPDNYCYIGLTFDINKRFSDHLLHGPVSKHITNTGLVPIVIMLTDYLSIDKAQIKEGYWQRKYKRDGWILLHKAKPGGLGGGIRKWTKEAVINEFSKYTSISRLRENSEGAYKAARRNGWLNQAYKHLK